MSSPASHAVSTPSTFSNLGVSAPVVAALARRGISAPFAIQSLVLPDALSGRDVLAKSRTGSGKTLAFALPIVERVPSSSHLPSALVLVPTRELAAQVALEFSDVARAKGLRVATAYGGVPIPRDARNASHAHVLVATPGRLEDLASRRLVRLDRITILILDEADRMLDMGFQPQVDRIVRRVPADRQTMFFSATLDGRIGRIARAYTRDARMHEVHSAAPTISEVTHRFVPVTNDTKLETLLRLLGEGERKLALIFVRTKHGADRLAKKLSARGVRAAALHGDMTQGAREKSLARFGEGHADALVATDVAARGLDVDDISHVINYDAPQAAEDYIHRVGRTGRAGRGGTGITLVLPDQEADISRMAVRLKLEEEWKAASLVVSAPRVVYTPRGFRGGRSPFRSRARRRI